MSDRVTVVVKSDALYKLVIDTSELETLKTCVEQKGWSIETTDYTWKTFEKFEASTDTVTEFNGMFYLNFDIENEFELSGEVYRHDMISTDSFYDEDKHKIVTLLDKRQITVYHGSDDSVDRYAVNDEDSDD